MVTNATSYMDVLKTANLYIGSVTVNVINTVANSTVLGAATNSELTTTWSIKTYVDGKVAGGTPAGGANTYIQFNDSTVFNGTAGYTYDKSTNNVFLANTQTFGNSTVNASANSILLQVVNSTSTANLTSSALTIGSAVVNSTIVTIGTGNFSTGANVGANVNLTTTQLQIGNSVANTLANSIIISIANSTVSANHSPLGFFSGTSVVNSTAVAAGANVIISTVRYLVGNSTVNASANSLLLQVADASSIANLTSTALTIGSAVVNATVLTIGTGNFSTGANVGANVNLTTTRFQIGNSTVNSSANSLLLQIADASSIANLTSTALTIGSAVVNSTILTIGTGNFSTGANVGANVNLSTVDIRVGNSTVNAFANSLIFTVRNASQSANLVPTGLVAGIVLANLTNVAVGANVVISATDAKIGNTIANTTANSIMVQVTNSTSTANLTPVGLTVGTTVANGTQINVQDIVVSGNLTINGTLSNINATNLSVTDSLIKLANGNATVDTIDVGFYGSYGNSTVTSFTGLFRDATDDKYKLFKFLQAEPTTTVNIAGTGYVPATLVAALESSSVAITGGTITGLSSPLPVGSGGTGVSAFTANGVFYGSTTSALGFATGADGTVLQSAAGIPSFGSIDCGVF